MLVLGGTGRATSGKAESPTSSSVAEDPSGTRTVNRALVPCHRPTTQPYPRPDVNTSVTDATLPVIVKGGSSLNQPASTWNCTPGRQSLPHGWLVGKLKLNVMLTGTELRLMNRSGRTGLGVPVCSATKSQPQYAYPAVETPPSGPSYSVVSRRPDGGTLPVAPATAVAHVLSASLGRQSLGLTPVPRPSAACASDTPSIATPSHAARRTGTITVLTTAMSAPAPARHRS